MEFFDRPYERCTKFVKFTVREGCETIVVHNILTRSGDPYEPIKLGYFIANKIVFICYKHSSLTTSIGQRVKTKIDRIDV